MVTTINRPYGLLRAGFPYLTSLGMRRMTTNCADIAIGQEGRLYSLNHLPMQILRFNWDDEDLGGWSGTGENTLGSGVQVLADKNEDLWISDEGKHCVFVYTRDGEFIRKIGEYGDGDGQLNRPSGIVFDSEENLYVVDSTNHRIQKFANDGKFLSSFGSYGSKEGELNLPWGIEIDEVGDIYVADWRNDRIQKFTNDGKFIMSFGTSGDGDGQFNRPTGLALDPHGDIYVADWGNNRIQQFDQTGRFVDKFIGDATMGKAARTYMMSNAVPLRLREMRSLEESKRFRAPMSVRMGEDFKLYIPDYAAHRIQIYQKEAYPLKEGEIAEPLRNPTLTVT